MFVLHSLKLNCLDLVSIKQGMLRAINISITGERAQHTAKHPVNMFLWIWALPSCNLHTTDISRLPYPSNSKVFDSEHSLSSSILIIRTDFYMWRTHRQYYGRPEHIKVNPTSNTVLDSQKRLRREDRKKKKRQWEGRETHNMSEMRMGDGEREDEIKAMSNDCFPLYFFWRD